MTEAKKQSDERSRSAPSVAVSRHAILLCPNCKANLVPSKDSFAAYLWNPDGLQCPDCNSALDWWQLIVDELAEGFLGLQYAPVRSHMTVAKITATKGEQAVIDLAKLEIPKTARILEVVYTGAETEPPDADGALVPLEVHANRPERNVPPDRDLLLFPMPIGKQPPARQEVSILFVWIDKAELGIPETSLIASVEAFNENRLADAIIAAATAVEVAVEPVLSGFLEAFVERNASEGLLRSARAYGQQEALLPVICGVVDAPILPPSPASALRELRKLRNKSAHAGTLPKGTGRKKVAEKVAAAIFSVEHAQLVSGLVDDYVADA